MGKEVTKALQAIAAALTDSRLALGSIAATDFIGNLTATSGANLLISAVTGKDIVLKLTDANGARKLSLTDSADAEQFKVDSNGNVTATKFTGAIVGTHPYAHTSTSGAPTSAECISAFGAVATVGAGFIGVYKDDATDGKTYFVICDGAAYHTLEATAGA